MAIPLKVALSRQSIVDQWESHWNRRQAIDWGLKGREPAFPRTDPATSDDWKEPLLDLDPAQDG